MRSKITPTSTSGITITENIGEWHVTIREGEQVEVLTFTNEAFATAFAEGQRVRLGLASVTRDKDTSAIASGTHAASVIAKAPPETDAR